MSIRVSPIERIRAEIDDLFGSERELGEVLEEVARLGVRLLMQTAIEAEVTEFLGPGALQPRRARPGRQPQRPLPDHDQDHGRAGHARPAEATRHRRGLRLPAARRRGVPHQRAGVRWSSPASCGACRYATWKPALADALGAEAALSKSTVSGSARPSRTSSTAGRPGTCRRCRSTTCSWTARTSRCTEGARAEPVLAAWGITSEGRPVLVGLEPGASESTDAWTGFLEAMVTRGLRAPLLVVSDGAPGLIAAVELVFPHSLRQRCAIHRARNVLAKVPVDAPGRGQGRATGRSSTPSAQPPGQRSIAVARTARRDFVGHLRPTVPLRGGLPERRTWPA